MDKHSLGKRKKFLVHYNKGIKNKTYGRKVVFYNLRARKWWKKVRELVINLVIKYDRCILVLCEIVRGKLIFSLLYFSFLCFKYFCLFFTNSGFFYHSEDYTILRENLHYFYHNSNRMLLVISLFLHILGFECPYYHSCKLKDFL
jgi:hypothetical protein